ncbi:glycerol-3-phosphate dehydrogenase (NAD(P)+) [Streptoalloteichus tenebrarius]|uniref:Glycerol-3-phosphate dehydrogenase [NAD(P)+] n=1 Tax=Streptoalloteichus tenebrarius (strain ATCC 17920 / DSM 40477 / JCM 4838 / CBS 697.72 / NBRC 16177 / NCIMB 11028 / NRRL B-12390 / A12253. 1 / ISP 5477) TaxID=1933 RepID=A0ABT1HZH8_STRSD|nr:NAD(P)H-dependent glycerol-3-phosphate dehydrogenase [Streptoalloteichus tenebrarius]MCP2260939.1 glycerol-3-phosphate dehydrogenase (NAD(P)+) [Streptoalloteichus tenebrarius]BFF03299.1 NAD(P)H-dependent glycerol-3-phosphate dehydrogenase [Streptoalloteichus tenebrarius]
MSAARPVERVAVLGAGSWGTAFAKVLADAGRDVVLWARRPEVAEAVGERGENPEYLPGVRLPDALRATADPVAALEGADAVVLAVPSQTLRANLAAWRDALPADATLVSLAKGVELGTLARMSEVIREVAGVTEDRVAVVSGPNLAREIAEEQPTATVIACVDHDRAVALQHACSTGYFRPYTNTDVVGCEVGGACKNVIALACGLAGGLGYGDNTMATLITRGLAETSRLGVALGADPQTFAGLAGLGDLVATCASPLSRNRTFGERLGRGETLEQAQEHAHGQVAEGVKSCSSIRQLAARHGVEMPIADAVHRVCHEGLSPRVMAADLLGRQRKAEFA